MFKGDSENLYGNVATQFPTLDYSHGWIPLFWGRLYQRRLTKRWISRKYATCFYIALTSQLNIFRLRRQLDMKFMYYKT